MPPAAESNASAAPERTDRAPLAELLNQEAGQAGEYELKVMHAEVYDYGYTYGGNEIKTQKLQVEFQSPIPEQYCLGIAKLQKKDKKELQKLLQYWKVGSTWILSQVKLTEDKSAFVNTACQIVIDLRKSKATAMLQSASFPDGPTPTTTIAEILQLKQTQRFDLIAIPAAIIAERRSGAGQNIADVRLIDGSKDPRNTATELVNATLPLTLFFKSNASFASFKQAVGGTPLLFVCLQGRVEKNGSLNVTTIKDMSRWESAVGDKCDTIAALAQDLCSASVSSADVAQLPAFQPQQAADYSAEPATLSACGLLDLNAKHEELLGDATERLYQLNHVYVVPPSKTDSITAATNDRLFGLFEVWDYSKKTVLGCRSKAMLQLALCADKPQPEQEYKEQHSNGELRHPLLASLRVRIKKRKNRANADGDATEHTQHDSALEALIVEAEPCSLTDIPNDSVDAIHGLLAAGPDLAGDRFVAASLKNLTPSPFCRMLADGKPAEKSLVLLTFQQRANGKQISNGFRVVSDNVRDALDPSATLVYGTIACCTVEKAPDFTAAKDSVHLAIVCKVAHANKPQHAADLYIEAMEPVASERKEQTIAMMQQLQRISNVNDGNPSTSVQAAWQQRKCRRLQRYPTAQNSAD